MKDWTQQIEEEPREKKEEELQPEEVKQEEPVQLIIASGHRKLATHIRNNMREGRNGGECRLLIVMKGEDEDVEVVNGLVDWVWLEGHPLPTLLIGEESYALVGPSILEKCD